MTIASFAALAASVGVGSHGARSGSADTARFVLGVFLGSSAWWFALSRAASLLRGRLSARSLAWTDRISAGVLLAFGVVAVLSAVTNR
jgi:putative LysE/RhtB family amino acid efflux pump